VLVLLGTPTAEVLAGLDLRAGQYRSALAGRRCLILIDNA